MRWTLAAVILFALVAAVAPDAAGTAAAAPSAPAWVPCGGDFECAALHVPLDYGSPAAGTVQLALIRLPATDPARRIGPLFVNPGGPGGSAVDMVRWFGPGLAPEVRARFDIVAFDPRGVGGSSPLACRDHLAGLFGTDPTPDTPDEWAAIDGAAKALAAQCGEQAGTLLAHMGTEEAARDMDQVRAALGDEQLSYFGFSYGTVIGSVYAGLFPARVRAMALDGAYVYWGSGEAMLREQSEGFENALHAFLLECQRLNCSLAAGGDPWQALGRVVAAAEAGPIPAPSASRAAGPGEVTLGILRALYSQSLWPLLAAAVTLADNGDASLLVHFADDYLHRHADGTFDGAMAAYLAVSCSDHAWPETLEEFQALAVGHGVAAPHFGVANLLQSALACAYWPASARPLPAPTAAGAPPVLVVATTGDPATPYAQGVAVSERLASGTLLTYVGEGHTAYTASGCVRASVDEYLLTITPPPAGSSCYPGMARLVPPVATGVVLPFVAAAP